MKRMASKALSEWQARQSRKPLIVEGARQVGKTHLLKEFGKTHFATTHYFNFEERPSLAKIFDGDLTADTLLRDLALLSNVRIDPKQDLIIFDEIQACPAALTSLKYFAEKFTDAYICAAGSLLGLSLSEGSFPVGKVEFLELFPLSFPEFLQALNREDLLELLVSEDWAEKITPAVHQLLWEYLRTFICVGGLPEPVATYVQLQHSPYEALIAARQVQRDLLVTYERDIAKHSGKLNAMHISRVLYSVGAQLGKNFDGSVKRFRFLGVIPGAVPYERIAGPIDWLVQTGLVYKVPIVEQVQRPLTAHTKENIFKLYFFDTGLLGALSEISPQAMFDFTVDNYKGFIAENYVAQELHSAGIRSLFGWNRGEAEIEFLVDGAKGAIPIEVKSGSRFRARSFETFIKRYAPACAYIISGKERFDSNNSDAVSHQPLFRAFHLAAELLRS
jgi:predicted AAA+ superfamily ATPase